MRTAIVATGYRFALLVMWRTAGCAGRASPLCSADPQPSSAAVFIDVRVAATAGGTPFAMNAPMTSAAGVPYRVSLLRYFVSHVALVDAAGNVVPTPLADAAGHPLEYGVTLVDYDKPETLALHLLAPPGRYTAVSFAVGVPEHCTNGGVLNHENASEQAYPLNVDTDMYWAWNPGYVFLKIEGHASGANGTNSFAYHVGGDKRFSTVTIAASLDVTGPAMHRLSLDVNRLFVTPSGQMLPDVTGVASSSISHHGPESDLVVDNYTHSEAFQWID